MPRGRPPKQPKEGGTTASTSSETASAALSTSAAAGPYSDLSTAEALTAMEKDAKSLIDPSLYRLTSGLPRHELDLMVREANECEVALIEEIRILERELGMKESELTEEVPTTSSDKTSKKDKKAKGSGDADMAKQDSANVGPIHFSTAEEMLASDLTPADQFYAVSALLGRLRPPLDTPLPPNWALGERPVGFSSRKKSAAAAAGGGGGESAEQREAKRKAMEVNLARQKVLLALKDNPAYTKRLDASSNAPLAAFCKKVTNHRTSMVFRRPVNPREAPGYTERIPFPIDLSLIKKMITAGMITSFQELHEHMGLICHNCVKYNGRESDYAVVTREFEQFLDDAMVASVNAFSLTLAAAAAKSAATTLDKDDGATKTATAATSAVKSQGSTAAAGAAASAAAGEKAGDV